MNWRYLCAPIVCANGPEGRLTGMGGEMAVDSRRNGGSVGRAWLGELYQRYQSVVARLIYVKRALQCRVLRAGRYFAAVRVLCDGYSVLLEEARNLNAEGSGLGASVRGWPGEAGARNDAANRTMPPGRREPPRSTRS